MNKNMDGGAAHDETPAELTTALLPSSRASSPSLGEDNNDSSNNTNAERDIDSRDTHETSLMAPAKHNVHRHSQPNRKHVTQHDTHNRSVSFGPDVKELVANINRDNYAAVVSLLEVEPELVNALDEAGRRPIVLAVAKQSIPLCEMLIRSGADVNAPDKDGYTAVMEACRMGNIDIVKQMLKNGGQVHARDHGGWTPLMWACYKSHVNVVKLLLEYGANPNMKDENSMSSLIWAAGRGHAEVVKLLCNASAKVDATDKFGNTALLWACRKRHSAVASILIDAGAKVDVAGMNSWTPLLAAINNNDVEVARQILKYGPNVNTLDKDGKTPIMIAAKQGCSEIALRLLECGSYVNVRDKESDTVLMIATKAGFPEIVQALLTRHADADAVNPRNGKTALFYAVEKNHIQVVDLLLRAKVNTELRSKEGDTPLFYAVRNRFGAVTQLLLHYNADICVVDKLGDTPLHVAVRSRNKKIADLLLRKPRYGKLLNKPNKAGETVYSLDQQNPKSLLASVLRPRKLNAQRTEDALLGYDVYSNALADILTDPSLTLPITVGLFSKWGSGKSFMIEKLHEDMEAFARQFGEPRFTFSWILFWLIIVVSATICSGLTLTTHWRIGVALGVGLLIVCHVVLGVIWYGCTRREWNSAFFVGQWLFKHFLNMKLLLQVIYCVPPGPLARDDTGKGACRIKFLFTERIRILSTELGGNAHKFLGMMLASLVNNLEREYGSFSMKMFYAFHTEPKSEQSRWKWKKICCIPYVFLLCVFILMMLGMLVILAVEKEYDEEDSDVLSVTSTAASTLMTTSAVNVAKRSSATAAVNNYLTAGLDPERKRELLDIGLWFAIGMMILIALAAIPACLKAARHLFRSRERRLFRMLRNLDRTNRPEDMLKALKSEFDQLVRVVRCVDAFAPVNQQQTRLVIVLDGSEGSDTQKVLHVVDAVKSLFTSPNMPFISLIAVDPHMIIGALEEHTHTQLQTKSSGGGIGGTVGAGATTVSTGAHHLFMNFPSTVNGYDYLRTVIHLPVYLQNQTLLMKRALANAMANASTYVESNVPNGGLAMCSTNFTGNMGAGRNSISSVGGARQSRVRLSTMSGVVAAGLSSQAAAAAQGNNNNTNLAVPSKRFLSLAGGASAAQGIHNSSAVIGGSAMMMNANTRTSNVDILASMAEAEKAQMSTTALVRRPSKLLAGGTTGLPSFRQQSVMLRLTGQDAERGASQFFLGGQSPGPATAGGVKGEMSRSVLADDYFSDLHPNTLRRLMNIIFLMGRLLKAFDLPFNWYRLSAWVHITEQWPYRISYILLFYEYNEAGISDSMTLRELYAELKRLIPNSSEDEPLLEIDRNVRKFDSYMKHQNPPLTIGDMKVFLPLSINLDPFLRKLIKDRCSPHGDDSMLTRQPNNGVVDIVRPQLPSPPAVLIEPPTADSTRRRTPFAWGTLPTRQQAQPPQPALLSREAVQRRMQAAVNSRLIQSPVIAPPPLRAGAMQQPDLVPTAKNSVGAANSQNSQRSSGGTDGGRLVVVNGQLVEEKFVRLACEELELMNVDDVCDRILSQWLNMNNIAADDEQPQRNAVAQVDLLQRYSDTIRDENITGAVLLHCDLSDLRQVLSMRFGDWELFRHRILLARAADEESATNFAAASAPAKMSDAMLPLPQSAAAAAGNYREDKHDGESGNRSDSVIDIDIECQQIKYAPPSLATANIAKAAPQNFSSNYNVAADARDQTTNKDFMSSEESHFASVFRLPQFQTPIVPPQPAIAETAADNSSRKPNSSFLQLDGSAMNIVGSRLSMLSTSSRVGDRGSGRGQRVTLDPMAAITGASVVFGEQPSPVAARRNDTFTNMVLTEGDILENAVMNATEDYYYDDDDDDDENLLPAALPVVDNIGLTDKRLYEAADSDADAVASGQTPASTTAQHRKKSVKMDFNSNPGVRGRTKQHDHDDNDDEGSDVESYRVGGKDAEAINQLALEQLDLNFASNEDLGEAVRLIREQQMQQKNNVSTGAVLPRKSANRRLSDTALSKRPSSSLGLTTTTRKSAAVNPQPTVLASTLNIPKPADKPRKTSMSKTAVSLFAGDRNSGQQALLPQLGRVSRTRHISTLDETSYVSPPLSFAGAQQQQSPPRSDVSVAKNSRVSSGEKTDLAVMRPSMSAIAAAAAAVAVVATAMSPTQSTTNPSGASVMNFSRQLSGSSTAGLNMNNNSQIFASQSTFVGAPSMEKTNDPAVEMRSMLRDIGSYNKPPPGAAESQLSVDGVNEVIEAARLQVLQQQKQATKKKQQQEKQEQKEKSKESRWTSQAETFQDERKTRQDDDTDEFD